MIHFLLYLGLTHAGPARVDPGPIPPGGTDVASMTEGLPGRARQAALVDQLLSGNVPSHVQTLVPVRYTAADTSGRQHRVELSVTPDYLCVGTDDDFLRAPLDLPSAIRVARAWQMVLPTTRIVDAIHDAAVQRFAPRPMPPSDHMRSVEAYLQHRQLLADQGATAPAPLLRAGHKKDLVLTPRLERQPDRVAIYGWHRTSGTPIQPLSLWHGAGYTDYSHGVRLVAPTVHIDGVAHDLFAVLADPVLWPLVSDEGAWEGAREMVWPESDPEYPTYRPDPIPTH